MSRYIVFGTSHVPIHCVVEANSEKEAMEEAEVVRDDEIISEPHEDFWWSNVSLASEVWKEKTHE